MTGLRQKELTIPHKTQDSESDSEIQFSHHIPRHKEGSIYGITKDLINDEKLSVCRDTGTMKC